MKNTIKILQINKLYFPWIGGMETVVQNISEGLKNNFYFFNKKQNNFYLEVLTCGTKRKTKIEIINKIKITKAGSLGIFLSMPISFLFPFILRKKIKKFNILHFHLPFPLGVMSYLFFCLKNKNQKIVVTWHSDILKQKIFLWFYKPFLIMFLKRTDKIIVTSTNYLKKSPFLKNFKNKCVVIPIALDVKKFQTLQEKRIDIKNPKNKKIILFVGRLSYYKGLNYLIKAMNNVNALLLIVGNGSLKQKLKKQMT